MARVNTNDFSDYIVKDDFLAAKEWDITLSPFAFPYYSTVGGGTKICPIWYIFLSLGLTTSDRFECALFMPEDIIENITRNKRLVQLCRLDCEKYSSSSLLDRSCGYFFDCLEEKTDKDIYSVNRKGLEGHVFLELDIAENTTVTHGRHRVCAARRSGVPTIPATIMFSHSISSEFNSVIFSKAQESEPFSNADIVSICDALNRASEKSELTWMDIDELLSIPPESRDIVDFLECKTQSACFPH